MALAHVVVSRLESLSTVTQRQVVTLRHARVAGKAVRRLMAAATSLVALGGMTPEGAQPIEQSFAATR
ncbi:MAG: hypothetical protein IPK16_08635 [Anaerolineales bacterium]|nr:hypothetical protein [Anaerolineales bacterium]